MTDVIKVTDYPGVDPTGVSNSAAGVQTALDAAFGTAASPHGAGNSTLNKPVFFPAGTYLLNSPLTLTRVVGGWIFGAATGSTILTAPATAAIFAMNGCSRLTLERMELINNGPGTDCIDLDWDNAAGGDGLRDNTFRQLLLTGANYGVRIAKSGFGGANNSFEHVLGSNLAIAGIKAVGTGATNNASYGGGFGGPGIAYWSSGGSIHVFEPSVAANSFDIQVDSGYPVCWIGGRTEGPTMVKLSSGLVTVRGVLMAGYSSLNGTITGNTTLTVNSGGSGMIPGMVLIGAGITAGTKLVTNNGGGVWTITSSSNVGAESMNAVLELASITGGKISIEGVAGAGAGASNDPVVNGNAGSLYLRANAIANTAMLTNYSGTVVQNI